MKNVKVLLLDADGLILKKARYFSEVYSQEYGVPIDVLMRFFRGVFKECQRGKADLKQELAKVLSDWKWPGTVGELLDYWFSSCTILDEEVMKAVQVLREKDVKCFLATGQERYRGEYILNNLGMGKLLDGAFSSYELGYLKSEKEFFLKILEKLKVPGQEILFLDNDEGNVNVARSVGIQAKVFSGPQDLSF